MANKSLEEKPCILQGLGFDAFMLTSVNIWNLFSRLALKTGNAE
jgi:hypothetical protein